MKLASYILPKFATRRLNRFRSNEDGGLSLEFVILFPFLVGMLFSSFESGILMMRNAMLDRGVDKAVREVRLNTAGTVDADMLKVMICDKAGIIPDCISQLKVEMIKVNLRNWEDLPATLDCVDRNEDTQPLRNFTPGGADDVMILRVCSLFDPVFPTSGIGFFQPPEHSGGAYALTATSAFVMEPI